MTVEGSTLTFPTADRQQLVAMRVVGQRQVVGGDAADEVRVELQLGLEGVLLLPAVDGQDEVRRDVPDRLGELEVVLVLQPLAVRQRLTLGGGEPAGVPQDHAHCPADVGRLGDQLGKAPEALLAQTLGMVLKRSDFGPEAARVDVVRTLGKIQDAAAVTALTDYLDATPKTPPRQSRDEAQKMVSARLGGGAK